MLAFSSSWGWRGGGGVDMSLKAQRPLRNNCLNVRHKAKRFVQVPHTCAYFVSQNKQQLIRLTV